MPTDTDALGGRLPLMDRDALTPDQEALAKQLETFADGAPFEAKSPDGRPIGPFNPALLNPALSSAFVALQVAEMKATSLSQRVRQVVILAVGAVWGADYELYAHSAEARKAGLSGGAVRELAAGRLPEELSDDEQIAQRLARRLTVEHHVDDAQYEEATHALGARGVLDITYLVGIYHTVCATLNVFAVPAPDDSRTQ